MSFLHLPLVVAGSLLVAVPVVLHLMMRRKPQPLQFPALRFVQRRQVANQRRIQLRHWALLALRCAAVVAVAAALARPIVSSVALGAWLIVGCLAAGLITAASLALLAWQRQRGSGLVSILGGLVGLLAVALVTMLWRATHERTALPVADAEAPVAAVLLFDTSPRMGLVQKSQSRLEAAQELAKWLLRQLPQDSQIAVLDTQTGGAAFAVDRAAAANQLEALETGFAAQPLPRMIDVALQMLRQTEQEQRELYVFTDLTRSSWKAGELLKLAESLDQPPTPLVYLLDIGVQQPRNLSLGNVMLSREHISRNAPLGMQIELNSLELAGTRQVELRLERPDPNLPIIVDGIPQLPELKLRSQREVTLEANQSEWIDFTLRGLPAGTHHGQIQVTGGDGLEIDDTRYFSIAVHPPWPVLVAAGPGAQPRFLIDALAPYQFRETNQALFECRQGEREQLDRADLSQFAAIALLDPAQLPAPTWRRLRDFVRQGGGLGIFLGRNAVLKNLNELAAQEVLPATFARVWRAGPEDILLSLTSTQHPILQVMQPMATSIPWNSFPVYRHWMVDETSPASQIVMRFGNGKPALIEGRLGQGRTILMTTPVSDPLNVRGRPPWNKGTDSWPYVVLVNEIFKYLVQGTDSGLNYTIGQTARLNLQEGEPERFQLYQPEGVWQDVAAQDREIVVPFTEVPGIYRLKTTPPDDLSRGFSVNVAAEATQLDRIGPAELDKILGTDNYRLARDRATIDRGIGVARRGHEFYPWVMLLVVLVLAVEHLLSNRFYGSGPAVAPLSTAATRPRAAIGG